MSIPIIKSQIFGWKPITGFPNYQVSKQGFIRNVKTRRILKTNLTSGYPSVTLCHEGKKKNVKIHRLVALAFLPLIEGKNVVNHKDHNKTNNHITNLEWCTHQENIQHASSLTVEDVRNIKLLLKGNMKHAEIARMYEISVGAIGHIKHGRRWSNVA